MGYLFFILGLALLIIRILFSLQTRSRFRDARAVKVRITSTKFNDVGGWWAEVEYRWKGEIQTGQLVTGSQRYDPDSKVDCLLMANGRLLRLEDMGKVAGGKGILLPAVWFFSASAFSFLVPDMDLWRFFLLSLLSLFSLFSLQWGFFASIQKFSQSVKKEVLISDIKIVGGRKYYYEYEYLTSLGNRISVTGNSSFIRDVSLDYLKYQVGKKARVRIDKKTGEVYETAVTELVSSILAFGLCVISMIVLINI